MGVPQAAATRLTMRSRLYSGVRIEGVNGPLGALLVESLTSAGETAQVATGRTVLDRNGIEAEVKASADRLARLLEVSRGVSAAAIERARREVQEQSFGVFRGGAAS